MNLYNFLNFWRHINNLAGEWETTGNLQSGLEGLPAKLRTVQRMHDIDTSYIANSTEPELDNIAFVCEEIKAKYCSQETSNWFYAENLKKEKDDWQRLPVKSKKAYLLGVARIEKDDLLTSKVNLRAEIEILEAQEILYKPLKAKMDTAYFGLLHHTRQLVDRFIRQQSDSLPIKVRLLEEYKIELSRVQEEKDSLDRAAAFEPYPTWKDDSIALAKQKKVLDELMQRTARSKQLKDEKLQAIRQTRFICPQGDSLNNCAHNDVKSDYYNKMALLRENYQETADLYYRLQEENYNLRSKYYNGVKAYHESKRRYMEELRENELINRRLSSKLSTFETLRSDLFNRVESTKTLLDDAKRYRLLIADHLAKAVTKPI